MKRIAVFLVCTLLLILAACAAAEDLMPLWPDLAEEVSRSDLGLPKKTKLPVFSAPLDNAWRGAKGKAAVSVDEPFGVLGTAQGGQWLLIDYSVSKKERRIGWISRPAKYEPDRDSALSLSRSLYRVRESGVFTDDPEKSLRAIRTLRSGETVIVMSTLSAGGRNWLYAEAEVDGRPAWGFAEAGKLEPLSAWTAEGDRIIGREGMTWVGYSYDEGGYQDDWDEDGGESGPTDRPGDDVLIRAGEFDGDPLTLEGSAGSGIRQVVLPSSLRKIGDEAVYGLSGQELILSGSPAGIGSDAFRGHISRLILTADYTGVCPPAPGFLDSWEVREGNPAYKAVDGVLFSADGRVLLSYPGGKEALHYDVPAGTEEIAAGAFSDGSMGLPLQTVSLPIGLRRIGAYAFSGCGRLHSLAVPLTVTDLAPNAFHNCVSLERLSLPPGFSVTQDDYALHEDLSRYMGDNGATLPEPRRENNFGVVESTTPVTVSVWLSGENGEGPVPVYDSAEAGTPVREKASGTSASYTVVSGSRVRIWDSGRTSWIDLANILPAGRRAFFEVSGMSPTAEGREALRQKGMETWEYAWISDDDLTAVFSRPSPTDVNDSEEIDLPLTQASLYRENTGDGRTLALLWTEQPGQAVRLLDAPGGAAGGWTYRGEQAEVLETDGDWARIRTVALTGWVRTENLIVVEPLPAGLAVTPVFF